MATQHLVGVGIHNQLHQRTLLALGKCQFHRPEAAFENLHLVPGFNRLFFTQAHGADVRQAEHCRRDHPVIHRAILLGLEQTTRHSHTFSQCHRRQLHATNHIANGQDRWLGALVQIIHFDKTALVEFDCGVFQAQVVEHRPTARGVEHTIGDQLAAVLERGLEAAIGLLVDPLDIGVELYVHAALDQFFVQMLAHRTVEAAQEHLAAIQQGCFRTQTVENPREFDGNIATAHHQHTLWKFLEEKRLVGADGVFMARNVRDLRPAASRDQDMVGSMALTVDFNFMGAGNFRVALDQADAAIDQQVAINTVETVDLAVLVGNQGCPVEIGLPQAPAKTRSLLEVFGKVCAVHQQLFRHTTHVDAGTAQIAAFCYSDFCTETCGKTCSTHATGTRTNYKQIKFVGHFTLLSRPSA